MRHYIEFTDELKKRIEDAFVVKKQKKIKGKKIAEIMGVHRTSISHFENFKHLLKPENIEKYFKIIDEFKEGKRCPITGEIYIGDDGEKKYLCYHKVNGKYYEEIDFETVYSFVNANSPQEAERKYRIILSKNHHFRDYILDDITFKDKFFTDEKGAIQYQDMNDLSAEALKNDGFKYRLDLLKKFNGDERRIKEYEMLCFQDNVYQYFDGAKDLIEIALEHIGGIEIELPERFFEYCANIENDYAEITIKEI